MRGRLAMASVALLAASTACSSETAAPGGEKRPVAVESAAIDVAWAMAMNGPTREDEIDGVAADDEGALWVTGKFEAATTLGGQELTSAGRADIPLARFDASGEPLWVRSFGGPGEDNLFDLDAAGTIAVGTGWFEGTIGLDDLELTSAGSSDCMVVGFDEDGSVRWAKSFGGPGPDGCNEVVVSDDGSITTSIDTNGGWLSPAGDLPVANHRDTVVMRLDAQGEPQWGGVVGGPGPQRGKSLAVTDDGSVAFGGDTVGDVSIGARSVAAPGRRTDAWVSTWTPEGEAASLIAWGGDGADIAKGLAFGADGLWAVGTFEGVVTIGGATLDAGDAPDLAVVRMDGVGKISWVGSVRADGPLAGAEAVAAPDGGVLFGSPVQLGSEAVDADGGQTPIEGDGAMALLWWSPDGSVALARSIEGSTSPGADEIARHGDRVYLELVIRGDGNEAAGTPLAADAKDGSVWALDLSDGPHPPRSPSKSDDDAVPPAP